ncbi:MAG: hypothetical protein GX593_03035 [Actinomycetales bacterium]|nr:hypothetical protein [Actinomycetales bacterium]
MAKADTIGKLRSRPPRASHYEYREVRMPRYTSPSDATRLLTEAAEYGRWELARTSLYLGGERRVWLRRRIIKVESTLDF